MKYANVEGDIWIAYDLDKGSSQILDKSQLTTRVEEITTELKGLPSKADLDEACMKLNEVGISIEPQQYGHITIIENEKIETEKHLEGMK